MIHLALTTTPNILANFVGYHLAMKLRHILIIGLFVLINGAIIYALMNAKPKAVEDDAQKTFTPHVDCGDNVIIINAEKAVLTGNKLDQKMYYNHSGYPGGLRERTAKTMKEKYPVEMVERAVKGMLPKGRLGREMYRKLFVYAGSEHKHAAQKPQNLEVK